MKETTTGGSWQALAAPILMVLAGLIPAMVAALYVLKGAVDVPYYDEWNFVPLVEKWASGAGSWRDLFAPYVAPGVSYVIPISKAAAVLSAWLLHWDVRFEVWVGFAMLLGTGSLVALYARRSGLLASPGTGALFLILSMGLIFCLRQSENLLGPWGVNFFGVLFFTTACLYLLSQQQGLPSMLAAMAAAAGASLSLTNGLLAWPLGLVVTILCRDRRQVALWLAGAAAFVAIFFAKLFVVVPVSDGFAPAITLQRFLVSLGGALATGKGVISGGATGSIAEPDLYTATLVGAGVVVLSVRLAWLCRTDLRRYAFPLSLLLFSLASCLLLAHGRWRFGVSQALASRYTSVSLIAIVCVLAIILQLRASGVSHPHLTGGLVALIVLATVHAGFTELAMLPHRRAFLERWASAVRDYGNGADLSNPHFSAGQIREYAAALDRLGLTVFRHRSAQR